MSARDLARVSGTLLTLLTARDDEAIESKSQSTAAGVHLDGYVRRPGR